MDVDNLLLSMKIITDNARNMQSDINKIESDVSTLQSTGVKVNVSNQVTANSNTPVSSGAVYTYVNQNLSSGGGGGTDMAASFDTDNNTEAVSGKLVSDYLVNNNYVTSTNSSSSAGQVLTTNSQGYATWATPSSGSALPTGGTTGQVLTANSQGDATWETPGTSVPAGGTTGQVLTANSQGDPGWETLSSGSALPTNGATGQVLTVNSQGDPAWETISGSTAVYLAANASVASGASTGFIIYSPLSVVLQNGTFSDNAFSPDRLGDYKVTSNLTFIGDATVRIGKYIAQLSNNIVTAARSYDFRKPATHISTNTNIFNVNEDSASLIIDSGSAPATTHSSNGYQGGTSHYIDLTSFPTGSQLPTNFAFELVLKLNSPSSQSSTSDQPIFVVHKNTRGLEEHMIRLFRYGTSSDLRLQFNNSVAENGATNNDHHIAFNNNYQEFEHLFIQFTSSGCTVYRNGVQATATQSTSNPNNNQVTQTTPGGTAINVTKVTLGRYLDRNGSGSHQDNGLEQIKFFRYYTTSATADEVYSLYEQHALQLDVLGKSSGSGTVITQAIAQQLATTDSIKVHAEGNFTGYSGDAALIVEHVDGGSQGAAGPAGPGVPDSITGTSGQVLTLDSSNPAQAVWADIPSGERQPLFFHAQVTQQTLSSGAYATAWILKKENSDNFSSQFDSATNNNFVFHCRRATDYKIDLVTSLAHNTTGTKDTEVILEKHRIYTGLTNDVVTADASYDFRNATYTLNPDTTVARAYTLTGQGNPATLNIDAGGANPTIDTTDGIPGATDNFIALSSEDIPLHNHIGANSSGFSIEMYIKLNDDNDGSVFDVDTTPFSSVNSLFKVFHRGNTGQLTIIYLASNGNHINTADTSIINVDVYNFVHIIITMSAGGEIKVYQDKINTNTMNYGAMSSNSNPVTDVRIGREKNDQTGSLRDGCIEEIRFFRFYKSVLDADKVSQLYNAHVNGIGIFELDKAGDDTEYYSSPWVQQISLSTIARLELDDRLAIKYITSGSFTLGYYTNLFVTAQLGPQGPRGVQGVGLPSVTGMYGQVLTLDNSNPPQAVWSGVGGQKAHGCAEFTSFDDKIYIEEEGDSDLNNSLIGYNASNTNYTHNGTTETVYGHSNYPCIGTSDSTILDDHTTTLYGMTERYPSEGVTLINSPMNNGAPDTWRGNDRLNQQSQADTTTPPTRWRILTAGEYRVKATIALVDPAPNGANWTQAWIFVRAGQMSGTTYQNTTTVRVAAYQKMRPSIGSSVEIDERFLQFDEVLDLQQHDEVYIGMSHGLSTDGGAGGNDIYNDNYYMANIQTTFSIEQVLGQGLQGPAGIGVPSTTGSTAGQVLTSQGEGSLPTWTTVSGGGSAAVHGHATYLSNGSLLYNYNSGFTSITEGAWSLSDVSDGTNPDSNGYTSVHGMTTTYTPVGVTFVPSTTAMTTASGTVAFENNPVGADGNRLTPSRWRIITAGHYRIRATVAFYDANPGNRCAVHLWRRSGGTSQNAGTTVTLIGYQQTFQSTGTVEDFYMHVNVDGIYDLTAFDEVYCSVNGDDTCTYMPNLSTYFTIEQIEGTQGAAGTGLPSTATATAGQVLTLDSSSPPQAVWSDNGASAVCAQFSGNIVETTYNGGYAWPYTHSNAYWFGASEYTDSNGNVDFNNGIGIVSTQATQTVSGSTSNVFQANNIPIRFRILTAGIYKISGMVHYEHEAGNAISTNLTLLYRVRRPSNGGADTYPYDIQWPEGNSPSEAFEHNGLLGRSTIEASKLLDLQVGDEVYFGFSSDQPVLLKHAYNNFHIFRFEGRQGPAGPAGTGVPDVSTGTPGQVLTLDSSSPPQAVWSTPSAPPYISWKLSSNLTLNGSNADNGGLNHRIKDFEIYTLSGATQSNNITYSTTTGDFTIITPGLYNYSFTAVARPADGDQTGERFFAAMVWINNTQHAHTTGLVDWVESTTWNRNNICLNNVAYLNTGDIVHFKVQKSADQANAILVHTETNGFLAKIG